jgi:hypothetical protein
MRASLRTKRISSDKSTVWWRDTYDLGTSFASSLLDGFTARDYSETAQHRRKCNDIMAWFVHYEAVDHTVTIRISIKNGGEELDLRAGLELK